MKARHSRYTMDATTQRIEIKGLRDGLLISVQAENWQELQELLFAQIDERIAFFRGARLALEVGVLGLRVAELSKLRDALSEREISLWAVVSESSKTVQTAQLLGLATRISKQRNAPIQRPLEGSEHGEETALWIERTLRSGTSVEYAGNVVVLGDVNPGAEIVAEGDVLVWGRLRGSVHAGAGFQGEASQNPGAVVCALMLKPTRLQIASEITNLQAEKNAKVPQQVRLKNGKFVVEAWKDK